MILGKVVKISGDSFNRHEIIHLQSWRGPQKTPSDVNRVKKDSKYKFFFSKYREDITRWREDMNFSVRVARTISHE